MFCIDSKANFKHARRKLKDIRAKAKILFRIQKLETDEHFGGCKPIGNGISEMKINYDKGFRVYFKEKNNNIVILLIGGDKSTQQKKTSRKRRKSGIKKND